MIDPPNPPFTTGASAVALAGTLTGGGGAQGDALDGPGGLDRWMSDHRELVGDPGPDTPLRVAEFRSLRDAVRALLGATAERRTLPPDAVALVNDLSAAAPVRVELDATDPARPVVRASAGPGSPTIAILAGIARSAIEVVGGPDRDRLRRCEAPRCGRFFLAERRGTRWCSPACGNRARVARYHERRRNAP